MLLYNTGNIGMLFKYSLQVFECYLKDLVKGDSFSHVNNKSYKDEIVILIKSNDKQTKNKTFVKCPPFFDMPYSLIFVYLHMLLFFSFYFVCLFVSSSVSTHRSVNMIFMSQVSIYPEKRVLLEA